MMACAGYVTSKVRVFERSRDHLADTMKLLDVTEDITVYRFSEEKAIQYARAKIEHLATPALFDGFRSLRNVLAHECLLDLDESKQDLVQCKSHPPRLSMG